MKNNLAKAIKIIPLLVCASVLPAKAAGVFYAFGMGVSFQTDSASAVVERYYNLVDTVYAPADVSGTAVISSTLPSSLTSAIDPNKGGSLLLRDAAGKTYHNGVDTVNSVSLFWRVFEKGTTPSNSFNSFNTTSTSNWSANGDTNNYFRGTAASGFVNILNGLTLGTELTPKVYVLDFYGVANFSYSGSPGGTFDLYQNNSSVNNYRTEFSLVPEPSSASLMALGTAGLLALRRRRNA